MFSLFSFCDFLRHQLQENRVPYNENESCKEWKIINIFIFLFLQNNCLPCICCWAKIVAVVSNKDPNVSMSLHIFCDEVSHIKLCNAFYSTFIPTLFYLSIQRGLSHPSLNPKKLPRYPSIYSKFIL